MQSIELKTFLDIPTIFCPKCGQKIIDGNDGTEMIKTNPCEHTMFIATDEGFEYVKSESVQDFYDNEDHDFSMDEYLEQLEVKDGFMISNYLPSPSGFGSYFGFEFE